MITYRWILLRTRGVPHKIVEKIETHILSLIFFFLKSCRLWNNVEKYGRPNQASDDYIIRNTCSACRITKATNTHSTYNTHCLATTTMVMRTLSNNTLYVHRPYFLTIQFTLASIMSVNAYLLRIVIVNCKMPYKLPFSRESSWNRGDVCSTVNSVRIITYCQQYVETCSVVWNRVLWSVVPKDSVTSTDIRRSLSDYVEAY